MALQFAFLKKVGAFLGEVVSTNPFKAVIEMAANVFRGKKPIKNIIGIILTVAGGVAGAVLFPLIPAINTYFVPIVKSVFPFFDSILIEIGVGFCGAWLGGALSYAIAKYIAQTFSYALGNNTNSDYHFHLQDEQLRRTVRENPDLFPNDNELEANVALLKEHLIILKGKIDTASELDRDKYKQIYLHAKRSNLNPLLQSVQQMSFKERLIRITTWLTGQTSVVIRTIVEQPAPPILQLEQQDPEIGLGQLQVKDSLMLYGHYRNALRNEVLLKRDNHEAVPPLQQTQYLHEAIQHARVLDTQEKAGPKLVVSRV